MVDFKKLRQSKNQPNVIEPLEIFRRLPKPSGINDLYISQAEVLKQWFDRRNDEQDLVIKLHTGGGKTLVGLLIAQSILNEHHEPVIYLAPTVQLVKQISQKAIEYNISAVEYEKNKDFSDDFLSGKSILICTYSALFNGLSKFGISGSAKEHIKAAAIILDDAHVSFSIVRDSFTLKVERTSKTEEIYTELVNVFRNDFDKLGKIGTLDDIISGTENATTLEVPYWSWKEKCNQVRNLLKKDQDNYKFVWSFIRDNFEYCHCLISTESFVITPIFPLVDMIPVFQSCPRRIFMSATISDDSSIVKTFNADSNSVAKPITSNSLAGVSERMILVPELMPFDIDDLRSMLKKMATWAAKERKVGTVILVSSGVKADPWHNTAKFADSTEMVATCVKQLQDKESCGPFIFANRYDGIDLPDSSCRLLILDGLPRGSSEYDRYRINIFGDGDELMATAAQKIEQGMGRGARGAGDYCVVVLTGKDLTAWFARSSNLKFLTQSTRAQFEMGMEISKSIADRKDLTETIIRCFDRDRDWTEYHAETLADLTEINQEDSISLKQAHVERKAFSLIRSGYFENAINKLTEFCEKPKNSKNEALDKKSIGWVYQIAARSAYYWGNKELSQKLQEHAFSKNSNLLRPQIAPPYIKITIPGIQAKNIIDKIDNFSHRRGYLSHFDLTVSNLAPEVSSNQFEQALADLGSILGFHVQRPDQKYSVGPDVLWLLSEDIGLVIEAKSRKKQSNSLNKIELGQLLNAVEWFKTEYPKYQYIPISVHPNKYATKSTVIGESRVLTLDKLNQLIVDTRSLLTKLCESSIKADELTIRCEELLSDSTLNPKSLLAEYFIAFELSDN